MSIEKTTEQVMDLLQMHLNLQFKRIPGHMDRIRKRMEKLKTPGYQRGDYPVIFRILILLSQNTEPLSMGTLSSELNVPMSTATRIIDGLVQGELLERFNDPNDRRVVRIGMSKKGREVYETGKSYGKQRVARLLKDFTEEEQAQILHLMAKLFAVLSKEE